jgi:hypothetical protein
VSRAYRSGPLARLAQNEKRKCTGRENSGFPATKITGIRNMIDPTTEKLS